MDPKKLSYSSESFLSFGQEYSSADLREIKQTLLSGNKEQIALAANRVLFFMRKEENILNMITSDVSEFLCDALLPFDPSLSSIIYKCLSIMTRYECFFTHNHSSFAIETVIRAMHFLIKNNSHDSSVSQAFAVLVLIVKGYVDCDLLPEKKNFENLMNLLLMLLKKEIISDEIKYQTGMIMKNLFSMELRKFYVTNDILILYEKWFAAVCSENGDFDSLSENFIVLGCTLCEQSLRLIINNNDGSHFTPDFKIDFEFLGQNVLLNYLISFLIQIGNNLIVDSPLTNQSAQIETLENYMTSLAYVYKELFAQRCSVTQRLSEMGFIQFITNILWHLDVRTCEKLGKISMSVLFEMIMILSDDVFQFPKMWPTGKDHFRKEILVGMSLLPLDSSMWMDALMDMEVNRSSKLALLVFFYFHSLTIKSPYDAGIIYPAALQLLNSSDGICSSTLLVKCIWFIYAMSQMLENSASKITKTAEVKKMVEILEAQEVLSLVYTHHPAILYWTFSSSKINCRIQIEVVKLWFENYSSDSTVLDDLVKKSPDVRLAIFELLQNSYEHVAHLAFSTLKIFMLQSDDNNLSCNIWFVLPQILAKYITDTTSAVNVDYILELATLKIPERPDMSKIIRIASLLPEALEKSDLISLTSALKLALQLFQIAVRYDDSRVFFPFLRFESFTQKIVTGIELDLSESALTSLKIISILWKMNIHSARFPLHYKRTALNPFVLLKILNGNDLELIKTSLSLMEQMLSTGFKSSLFFCEKPSPDFLKILFFDLENISIKYQPLISGDVWKCLKHCLSIDVGMALFDDVLLNEVIRLGLSYLKVTPEMAEFLIDWMEHKKASYNCNGQCRCIRESFAQETICSIAKYLKENSLDKSYPYQKVGEKCVYFLVFESCSYFFKENSMKSCSINEQYESSSMKPSQRVADLLFE